MIRGRVRVGHIGGRWTGTALATVALALVTAACGSTTVTASTGGTTAAPTGSGAAQVSSPATVAASAGDLTFRPVLEVLNADPTAVDPAGSRPADGAPSATSSPAGREVVLPGADTGAPVRYRLGPVAGDQRAIESATAAVGSSTGQWFVRLILRPGDPGIDTFNRAAGPCYEIRPTCPTGQLAIVVDGTVLSAPRVNAAKFARDQIQISAGFDEASAEALARRFTPH